LTAGERYLLLGLRLGRHVDGLVDAYYGPPELKHQADAEELVPPAALRAEADELLAEVEDGWLADQLRGLRTYVGVLAGDELSYSDEVEGCYGVRPTPPDPESYAAAHARLDELLPGDAPLAERREAFRQSQLVPREKLIDVLRDLVAELGARTARLVELPDGEGVDLELVEREPWWAFNYYLGDLRSRVVVNVDVATTTDELIHLAAHEVYPGHHTEHAVKEQRLLRERGLVEEAIQLVPTPQAVLSEGIAETGPDVVLDGEGWAAAAEIIRRHGLPYDERSPAIQEAALPLRRVGLDAALMIHERGTSVSEAEAYVRQWALVSPERATHSVRFVTSPTWRAYAITYSAGSDLCRAYVDGDPARFTRLLTEHVRINELAGR
jgi:hypothetical protein